MTAFANSFIMSLPSLVKLKNCCCSDMYVHEQVAYMCETGRKPMPALSPSWGRALCHKPAGAGVPVCQIGILNTDNVHGKISLIAIQRFNDHLTLLGWNGLSNLLFQSQFPEPGHTRLKDLSAWISAVTGIIAFSQAPCYAHDEFIVIMNGIFGLMS